jgi:uncharacterized membrane protein YdfJ with MMPL/SSD domain
MGFLFQGSGGTQQAQQQNASSNQSTTQSPEYMQYVNQILQQAQGLGQTPYQGYDVSKMFAPFTDAQNQAFGQIQQNASGAYQPYYNAAIRRPVRSRRSIRPARRRDRGMPGRAS